ncbi:leucine--tRNA ligase [Patescibacteria group bacterium]|nr:leucine--tRNA ligase [Patescibacteria group bacterium]MBU1705318.1 leucine--tRNA ligase [Patescibacteria group bacterium]
MPYNHLEIEPKWQARWDKKQTNEVAETKDQDHLYHLVMFPYPSGQGLHVGHVESYAALDILSRYQRMNGQNVLFPIGYDAFGLPAENYAIKTGTHPAATTKTAIENFRRQMKTIGLSFDWSREISTADPEYYQWTQWLFLKLYENDLAYRAKSPVNWCASCQTVLANEQVVDGQCERCKNEVVQKELEQWFFRITKYADQLLAGLEDLDWPHKIKAMQRHWIGKSEGVEIEFPVIRHEMSRQGNKFNYQEFNIPVFTTRPDTLMGVTYLVLAPEHPLVDELTTPEFFEDVVAYRAAARRKSELERTGLEKDKTGIFIGATAKHPMTGAEVPIWIADYALMNYGTGAVMAVPAHDERDFTFASKYDLPIKQVIASTEQAKRIKGITKAYTEPGFLVNSGEFDGLTTENAKQKIADTLESDEKGRRQTNYRLRDWLVSRQRYWGAPIPIIWCEQCGAQPVPVKDLPVVLPDDVDFKPTGESPLVGSKDFHVVRCPKCKAPARRESDTMDTFVDSSWYYLRYTDPHNHETFADPKKVDYWCPVDLYLGGAEHAVMHLLYARFFAYALKDLGLINFNEPFLKLRNQGLILGPDGDKMSKSKGNVVNPDEIVEQFGADTIRIYEMFMGPLEDAKPWNTEGAVGVRRFLDKIWNAKDKIHGADEAGLKKLLHKTIKKVTADIQDLKFNTAVSALMIMANAMQNAAMVSSGIYEKYLILLAPFAPHLAEELWEQTGHKESIFNQAWPKHDEALAKDDLVQVAVQVNGKVRGTMEISPDLSESDARARAEAVENVAKHLEGKKIVKVIYIPGRMVNLVVK